MIIFIYIYITQITNIFIQTPISLNIIFKMELRRTNVLFIKYCKGYRILSIFYFCILRGFLRH